jgi:hypothetical protein
MVDDDSTEHENRDNWAFTLGTTLDIALPVSLSIAKQRGLAQANTA